MEFPLIASLVLFPVVLGLLLAVIRSDRVRRLLVYSGVAVLVLLSGFAAWDHLQMVSPLALPDLLAENIGKGMLGLELLISGWLLWLTLKNQRWLAAVLVVAQPALLVPLELQHRLPMTGKPLLMDQFSLIMAVIIGVIGGLICVFSPSYMKEFHESHHGEFRDRRPLFFATIFVFLGAMYGIVFTNNLAWLYFFWEITTLCSFLLIGYKETAESRDNAFRALTMNLGGGVAFALAIALFATRGGTLELLALTTGGAGALGKESIMLVAALLAFAGMTKSAQFPFAGWLRGAMVAPTPVSALLHSSTMVKAGVYLVLRLGPVLEGTTVGLMVALVGAVTFLAGSLVAICTSDAKKVLAYSTVANLGLIVLCGGIGTYESMWAGILLIIFHAVAKCLLFLCVGVVEHKIHSRDIEEMAGLVVRMPKISVMMQIGIAGMFLAPFGMLISKWAVLKAVVDAQPVLAVFVIFGSSVTLFFWVKWLGKLLEVGKPHVNVEGEVAAGEWVALTALSALTVLTCLIFPLISREFLVPFIHNLYPNTEFGYLLGGPGNLIIMLLLMGMVLMFPLSFFSYHRKTKVVDAYLGGANVDNAGGPVSFQGSAGAVHSMSMTNYYLARLLGEERVFRLAVIITSALLFTMLFQLLLKPQ